MSRLLPTKITVPWSQVTTLFICQEATKVHVLRFVMPELLKLKYFRVQIGLENNSFGTKVIFWFRHISQEEYIHTINFDINTLHYSKDLKILEYFMLHEACHFFDSLS